MHAEALRAALLDYLQKPELQNPHCRNCMAAILEAIVELQETEIDVRTAAAVSGKSPSQIRRMIRNGQLTRYGGDGERLRVRMSEVPTSPKERQKIIRLQRQLADALRKLD